MKQSVEFGRGIRILNQEPLETLVSFITSTNKSIPMIKKIVEMLCKEYGDFAGIYRGREYYSFPQPEKLLGVCEDKLKECKMGFRAGYILDAAKKVSEDKSYFEIIKRMNSADAGNKLKEIRGVGDKVAHCVMLFSLGKHDSFPVDIWIKRIMSELYGYTDTKEIECFSKLKFGEYAGFAQQYLFYYARENNIGKNKKNTFITYKKMKKIKVS